MKALAFLTLTALVYGSLSGLSVSKPYEFKDYERYIYDYREIFNGQRAEGRFEILIRTNKGSFKITISGEYKSWSGVVSGLFRDAKELAGFVLMKSYFEHHWLVPLSRTLFSKGLVKVIGSREFELSAGVKKVDENIFRVVKKCKAGGLRGKSIEILKDKEVLFRLCLSREASLPIHIYRKTEKGNVYEIILFEYSDVK